MTKKRRSLSQFVTDLLFPQRCPWCGQVVGFKEDCHRCDEAVAALTLPHAALPQPQLDEEWLLAAAWACFSYEEPVRGAILRMKFENERNLAVPIGEQLSEKFRACGIGGQVDVIVPVPVSPKTARRRGYNQSALLAMELARHTGLPCLMRALVKERETAPQRELHRADRLTNVAGAYAAGTQPVAGRRVLLVDDIMTTGSTLNECAKTLLAAGAVECRALSIAASRVEWDLLLSQQAGSEA